MNEKQLGTVEALSTVFFQEGFNRKEGKHGLAYWEVSNEELANHCRQCKIYETEYTRYLLNTVQMNNQWYLRVYRVVCDEFEELVSLDILLLIPLDPERLCWEEMAKCLTLIDKVI